MCENTDSRCTTTRCRPRCPLSSSGLSCFLLLTSLCSRQREVSAAPHRGNTNRPLPIQGKANTPRTQTKTAEQAKNHYPKPRLLNYPLSRFQIPPQRRRQKPACPTP